MSNYQLRDYQERVLRELFAWFVKFLVGNPIVSACVAAGKSIIIAEFCRRVIEMYPNQRILMVVSSKELVSQNYEKLRAIYPEGNYGLYCAGLGKKNGHAQIVFATIGSIHDKAMQTGAFNLCIIDECHLVNPKEIGTYRKMIADYTRLNPKFRVIGFTGTPFRGNGILITEGEQALFTDIATEISIGELLEQGYLSPLVLSETRTKTDITGVHIDSKTGDFKINELAKAIDRDDVTKSVVTEIIEAGHDRKSWLIFGVDVQHCEHLHEELERRGIHGAVVHGKTPKAQRDRILAQFKAHKLRYVVNCQILTTGFDHAATDLIALVRNTRSPCLFVQMGGRGLRVAEGKRDCLWLDFTDSTAVLGSIDTIRGRRENKNKKDGTPILKKCPICGAACPPAATVCECGHEFEIERNIKVNAVSSDAPILSSMIPNKTDLCRVQSWSAKPHAKLGSPTSMQISYYAQDTSSGGNLSQLTATNHREWLCFDHTGYAKRKAEELWLKLGGKIPLPANTAEAVARFSELTQPEFIELKKEGKYYVVTNRIAPATSVSNAAIAAPKIDNPAPKDSDGSVSTVDAPVSTSTAFSRALSAMR
jgi:DNA repair protein RadD